MNTAQKQQSKHKIFKYEDDEDKNQTMISNNISIDESAVLLPGLPNHLSHLCLSSLHPYLLFSVCRSWRRLIYTPFFPTFLSLYTLLSHRLSNTAHFFSFDPISSSWKPLPTPPSEPLLHRHRSFISRNLSIQTVAVFGRLVLVAATTDNFLPALSRPLVFDPLSHTWIFGPPMSTPRRWCAAGSYGGDVYIASGVGSHYQRDVARSIEKWDMKNKIKDWKWEKLAVLKDGRFSREAVEAIGSKGKLFMVNVKGNAVKQGAVYDIVSNRWEEMREGMLAGWKGPAVADEKGDIYVVDEAKGSLNRYDSVNDCWELVIESLESFKGAEQMAAEGEKVFVVCAKGHRIAVVDVVYSPARISVVDPPDYMEVVAVHVLPRMCKTD